jgi:hypothetical protein
MDSRTLLSMRLDSGEFDAGQGQATGEVKGNGKGVMAEAL